LQPPQTPPPANSIFYNIDIGDLPTPMFQQAPMSPIFDVRCVHRPNSNFNAMLPGLWAPSENSQSACWPSVLIILMAVADYFSLHRCRPAAFTQPAAE